MLKVDINEGKRFIAAQGSGIELVADIASIIDDIYSQFKRRSPEAATMFRNAITHLVVDTDSPLWAGNASPEFALAAFLPHTEKKEDNTNAEN